MARSPIVLLIEHDDIDRSRLFRMLADRGYRIMAASRAKDALDTFVFHHSQIAVVLANARLPDLGGAQLTRTLYRIDPHVPVVLARHREQRLDGSTAERSVAFAELIEEVDRRVFPSVAARQAALNWPVRDDELDQLEGIEDSPSPRPSRSSGPASPPRRNHFVWHDDNNAGDLLEPVAPRGKVLKSVAHRDLRNYLASESSARRRRLRLIGRVAALIVILTTVVITLMLQFQTRGALASEPEARPPIEKPAWLSSSRLSLLPIDKSLRPSGLHELNGAVLPISAWS